jgi:hypothetical protein
MYIYNYIYIYLYIFIYFLIYILFIYLFIYMHLPGMVVLIYNSITQEAEAGGLKVPGQPGLHSKTLCQK